MHIPSGERPRHGDDQSSLGSSCLELFGFPSIQRTLHRFTRIIAAEQLQHAIAMMRKIRVQAHPATVAAAIESGNLVPQLFRWCAIQAHVALAAKLDRGVAHIDTDALL